MHYVNQIALSAALSLFAGAGVAMANQDLVLDYTNIQLHASSPTSDTGLVTAPMVVNQGFTQQSPWQIPCDVSEFSGGLWFKYANSGPAVYPEIIVSFYLNGDEHQRIVSHGFDNVVPAGFDHRDAADDNLLMSPGQTFNEGYIPMTQSVPFWQYGFQGSDLPANTPVKMHVVVNSYSCDTWDNTEGGYSPACFLPDAVPWNNAANIWMVRSCP